MLALRDAREPEDVLGVVTRALARDFRRTCTAYQLRDGMLRPVVTSDLATTRVPFPESDLDVASLRSKGLSRRGRDDLVPIAADGKVLAVLVLENGPPVLAESDEKYLRALGAHASLALSSAHAFEQLRRYASEGAALTEAAKTILGFTELEPLALALAKLCARLVPADIVAVYACRPDACARVGSWPPPGDGRSAPAELPADIDDARAAMANALPGMSMMVAPLIPIGPDADSRGFLVCSRRSPFERPQQRLVDTFVTLATLAVRNVELYEESTHANRALAESNAFKDDLMAMFAHDFKGPLTVISGFSELLIDTPDPEVRRSAETIIAQTRRLARLSEDALALAATQSAGFSLQRKREDLTEFVRGAVEPLDRDHRITISAPDEPALASFDRTRLRHVVDNVVGNALKYSKGPVAVTVEAGPDEVTVVVAAGGIGIPAKDLETIFARFGRARNARLSGSAGSGVGLYIAKKIVEVHGGRLEVASTENEGSSFRIVLPA